MRDSAPLSKLMSNYEALIGVEGFDPNWIMGCQVYKGGVDREVIRVIPEKQKKRIPEKRDFGQSNIIMLGGVFEEIGGTDEVIGGGNQKVGADN